MHKVYVLISADGSSYIGYTSNLRKRMEEHGRGEVPSTRGKEWRLAYYEAYFSKADACRRERRLKDARARTELMRRIEESMSELFPT